jgi:outer membrane protein OmpA-like peptidoglycan-associated protein
MFQRLGNAYYFNADLVKASQWYEALFEINPDQEAEYFYRYSQSLKATGNYDLADQMLVGFNEKSGNDKRANLFQNNRNYLAVIKANSGRYEIADAGINSAFSDYGAAMFGDQLVFASARDTGGVSKKVFRWTNQSFTNLYTAIQKPDGSLGEPTRLLNSKVNSKFHESTPVFTKDGSTMYFTRNNYLDGKKGKDSNKITLLKLYRASWKDGKWADIVALPFNSDQYSVAHPALSTDEKTLYFASDMPGTFGQSDLFKVAINNDGSYGTPQNLGASINTEGKETFPFISGENELYFASDGRPGLGGLDIYVTKLVEKDAFTEIQNVGEPVNSSTDDFAFIINNETHLGFFTSNRASGHGYDDIYKFKETRKIVCSQELSGIITDQETQEILSLSKVSLFDQDYKLIEEKLSDEKGAYDFAVLCGKKYYVRAEKEAYETSESGIQIATTTGESALSLALSKRVNTVTVGTDLAKTLRIPIIYFDLDKSFIREDAAFELAKVLIVLQENPTMKIAIGSHTDSRQTNAYNRALSDRRAKATKAWLVSKGVKADRLTAKGYGETQLVNHCADGVSCTEQEHQANRRSEFIIIAIE